MPVLRKAQNVVRNLMRHRIYHITLMFLFVIFMTPSTTAQFLDLDSTTTHNAQSLIRAGVDTVLIYEPWTFYSTTLGSDSSYLRSIRYIFTKKARLLIIERLTYEQNLGQDHGYFLTHKFISKKDSLGIFDYLHKNFKSIVLDTLRPCLLKVNINEKDTLVRHFGSHASYRKLTIVTASGIFRNKMLDFDLYDGTIRDENGIIKERWESVNYDYNISTSIYMIISMLQIEQSQIRKIYRY